MSLQSQTADRILKYKLRDKIQLGFCFYINLHIKSYIYWDFHTCITIWTIPWFFVAYPPDELQNAAKWVHIVPWHGYNQIYLSECIKSCGWFDINQN